MKKYNATEAATMPAGENDKLALEVAELRSDVRHIQSDVSDIKADLRISDQRLESFRKETDQKIDSLRRETADRFDKVDRKFDSLTESLSSAKLWALGLYIALAGSLFYAMARGFKWL